MSSPDANDAVRIDLEDDAVRIDPEDDAVRSGPEDDGVPFDEALGSLIREAEREGVDVAVPRDYDAVENGAWAVEITKVEFDRDE